jgi:hypothetical protein
MFPLHNWRQHRGFLAGITVFLIGIILILSDRIVAHTDPDRPWIAQQDAPLLERELWSAPPLPSPQPASSPLPVSQIVFPKIRFHFTNTGSYFGEIIEWIERNAEVQIDINWDALATVGLDAKSTFIFEATNISLPELLNALLEGASTKSLTPIAWEELPNRIITISTASDLTTEKKCLAQRQKMASPALRQALERPIPYVKLRELNLNEALGYCERISGVKILRKDESQLRLAQTDVIAQNITFERLIQLILHRTDVKSPAVWHFTVEGEGLLVWRDGGEK